MDGNTVGGDDIRAQTRQARENIKAALETAGAAVTDITRLIVCITDLANVAGCMEVRQTYFNEPYPASTILIVSGLAKPEWFI